MCDRINILQGGELRKIVEDLSLIVHLFVHDSATADAVSIMSMDSFSFPFYIKHALKEKYTQIPFLCSLFGWVFVLLLF